MHDEDQAPEQARGAIEPLHLARQLLQGACTLDAELADAAENGDAERDPEREVQTSALLAIAAALYSQASDRAAIASQGQILSNLAQGLNALAGRVQDLEEKAPSRIVLPN